MNDGRALTDYENRMLAENVALRVERDRARSLAVALENQLAAIEALAETWRYKGEFGWGAWQEGHGPDQEGVVLDECSSAVRAILRSEDE